MGISPITQDSKHPVKHADHSQGGSNEPTGAK